jgi:sugar lactone lactonase YvrE
LHPPGHASYSRFWITGPKVGTPELLADLPGYPDNVRPDQKGGYWVALHRERYELPFGPADTHLLAIRVGVNGDKLQDMRGPKDVRPTEVVEREDGKTYIGSVELPYVSIIKSTK